MGYFRSRWVGRQLFKVTNKLRGKGYDPVTTSDKAFEKFIRLKINKKFPNHQIIGEEFGKKNGKSDFSWVIDPIDGTRSYVIGNPTWSNLISLNYKNFPVLGLANFPKLNKYYLNYNNKIAYVFEKGKKRKLKVNKKVSYNRIKVAGAFHGWLTLNKQKKIPKILKLMQYPCFDALTYAHLCEGNIDVEMLSKGIYTAMVTTVAGLVVGIIAYISYNYLVSKVDKVVFQLEAKTTDFLDILHHND